LLPVHPLLRAGGFRAEQRALRERLNGETGELKWLARATWAA
jgi:hypothetical protein